MLYILNIVDLIKENPMYVILAVLAFVLLIILFCLIYSQNKVVIINEENEVNNDVDIDDIIDNMPSVQESVEESLNKVEKKVEDNFDLEDVTKTLETLPKGRTIQLTDYEMEQEENAIISYDELVTQAIPKLEISKELKEEVLPIPENQEYSNDLDYEEAFLDNLKNLNKSLN